ncbi:MAG TPA: DUF998 domain-containing protein [Chloroflexota bacterium]|nr:DUF998 domain-containing protein [Chloroflexota bacterium]
MGTAVRNLHAIRPGFIGRHPTVLQMLLALGVVAPIYYAVVNEVVGALRYPGYDPIARPVSELTATYATTRLILVPLLVIFDLLIIPFWIAVWRAAPANRALRLTSGLMLAFRALALLAFPFPMVADEVLGANTIHTVIWGVLTPLLMLAGIGASAAAFGKRFRVYAILTLVVLVAFSGLAGVQAAQVTAGEPVRWFGITERALIGIWLQWVAVLAIVLLRTRESGPNIASATGDPKRRELPAPVARARRSDRILRTDAPSPRQREEEPHDPGCSSSER